MERGEFERLPGFGKPLEDLGEEHDPDWWVKRLVERERITVLPPALQLRRDDAALDDELDRLGSEAEVRRVLTEFNERVRHVLYSTHGGPPVTTPPREVEAEVARWRARRDERRARRLADVPPPGDAPRPRRWRRWWFRRGSGPTIG
jgi:hypothetical protein